MISLELKRWISEILDVQIDLIFIGLYNNIVLPKTGYYIILQEQGSIKLETPDYDVNSDSIEELISTRYQIDFYRTIDLANQFYLNISSYNYPNFCNFIEFEPPKNLTGIDSEQKYLLRYSMNFNVSHTITTDITQNYFETAKINNKLIQ